MKNLLLSLLIALVLCMPVFSQAKSEPRKLVAVAVSDTNYFFVYPDTAFRTSNTVLFTAVRIDKETKERFEDIVMANCKTRKFIIVGKESSSQPKIAYEGSAMQLALKYVCELNVYDLDPNEG